MKSKMKPVKSKEFSYLYKTTFNNGDVYFHRFDGLKSWTVKQFIGHQLACAKSNKRNDSFAKRVQIELSSVLVEIVFYGTTNDCIQKKIQLINECKNKVVSTRTNDIVNKSKDNFLQLKREYTKVISNNGESIYYIDIEYGFRMGLKDKMITYKKHFINPNFVELNTKRIERI
jgi:hypothetical protein